MLTIQGLSKTFYKGTEEENEIFKDFSLEVKENQCTAILGPNGCGKSTLFKILNNKLDKDQGEVKFGSRVIVSYFDQEMENLNSDNTVIDEIWDNFPKLNHYEVRSYLAKFLFIGDDIFKTIDELSGGEKAKVSLLKIMLKGANLLLLDEPTNHLDIDSKSVLEDALNSYEGTVISISHDRYFLNSTCNKILAMSQDRMDEYLGNYDYYLEKTKKYDEFEEEEISKTQIANQKKLDREERNREKKRKEKLENLENDIHDKEDRVKKIEEELSKNETYEDIELVQDLSKERENLQEELDILYMEWIEYNE